MAERMPEPPASRRSVSVIIPTWNGLPLLKECVPALVEEMKRYGGECEVLIADDRSDDGTAEYVAGLGARFRLCRNDGPRGFGCNVNQAARQARHDLLFLLNNDVHVAAGLMPTLVKHFEDPSVFGVSPNSIVTRNGKEYPEMPTQCVWRHGILVTAGWPEGQVPPGPARETFHISGGFSFLDRRKFEELGGFDDLFNPFYWEDTDLSLRARRRGWRILNDATVTVQHRHQATIRKQSTERAVSEKYWRNAFLFNWIHVPEEMLRRFHWPRVQDMIRDTWSWRMPLYQGLAAALPLLPEAMARRRKLEASDAVRPERLLSETVEY